jgi:predicted aldo/keto reductase-like oxidoreductase
MMKWMLIIVIIPWDGGAHTNVVPFETKELCETAKIQLFPKAWDRHQLILDCAQVKP